MTAKKCRPELYKTTLCRNWVSGREKHPDDDAAAARHCPYLARCQFAHGPWELRAAPRDFCSLVRTGVPRDSPVSESDPVQATPHQVDIATTVCSQVSTTSDITNTDEVEAVWQAAPSVTATAMNQGYASATPGVLCARMSTTWGVTATDEALTKRYKTTLCRNWLSGWWLYPGDYAAAAAHCPYPRCQFAHGPWAVSYTHLTLPTILLV